jgi:hypothetical protein
MIDKGSGSYWAVGITLRCDGQRWAGELDYLDDGFADDDPDSGALAMLRIGEALSAHGWKPVRDTVHDRTSRPGWVGIPVEPIKED